MSDLSKKLNLAFLTETGRCYLATNQSGTYADGYIKWLEKKVEYLENQNEGFQ